MVKYLEINSNDFWKQVFYNSENLIQAVKIEKSNFQQEIAVKIKKSMHVEYCDTVFMEDDLIIVNISKQIIKEVLDQNQATILEEITDISLALKEITLYNKKNQIVNLRKQFNYDKKIKY